jgi:hypothetical protein
MLTVRNHRVGLAALAIVLMLVFAALIGTLGCGGDEGMVTTTAAGAYRTTAAGVSTTAAPATTVWRGDGAGEASQTSPPADQDAAIGASATGPLLGGTLTALQMASEQKIIGDAQIEIEVESGKFQAAFSQAIMLADRYGGYLFSSNSYATSDDGAMKNGTVAIRVPSASFTQAVADAGKLGILRSQTLSTQDVTEEYVDLQARIKNSEVHVNGLVALLAEAKTLDDILKLESVVSSAQQDLEQLKGRLRYLEGHTSYSTITMSIFEKGTEPVVVEEEPPATTWGVAGAFKDAAHYLVRVFNGIVRGLGVLIPILVVVVIIGLIAWRVYVVVTRRNRQKRQPTYQAPPQGSPLTQGWQATAAGPVPSAQPAAEVSGTDADQGGAETKK